MKKKHGLGEMLVKRGVITEEQFKEAFVLKTTKRVKLGQALIELGHIDEITLVDMLSKQLRIPVKKTIDLEVDPKAIESLPERIIKEHRCFPFGLGEGTIKLLVTDPLNIILEDEVFHETELRCDFYLSYENEVEKLIEKYYEQKKVMEDLEALDQSNISEDFFDISASDDNSPVIKIVNSLFKNAAVEGASDIHIGVTETKVDVRYRVDGILHRVRELPKHAHPALVSRIKTMADMDITERRVPQDGRIQITLDGKAIDMRVSTLPSVYGEKVTIRLLDKGNLLLDIKDLGFQYKIQEEFESMIKKPVGIILVTGPTGSGKSSTLYTVLNELNDVTKNIITLEDPVEYKLDGIVQVQVNPKAGLTFASGLRSILRQDPDIVLVGEIRDGETATIATKAANTGHLVLSTLHTNDAVSTITRLVDMGVEPYMVGSTVAGVVNQRLVRRICSDCKTLYDSVGDTAEKRFFGVDPNKELTLFKGEGCDSCKGTGYKGRLPVQELLIMTDEIKKLITEGASERVIREKAIEQGMLTMKQDGYQKALQGLTTLEEVSRFVV